MLRICVIAMAWGGVIGAGAPAARAGTTALTFDTIASSLNRPVFATHAPDGTNRLFIVEKRGVIKILDLNTETVNAVPFLDIDLLVATPASGNDERGLLGLAFHPDYANNGFFYVNYINTPVPDGTPGDTVVARYHVSGDPNVADAGSAMTIITFDQPDFNHNGGWLGFGPDGYLYIATGDGGGQGDPSRRAQNISAERLGKMLRLDVDSASPYAIPASNPFVGATGDDEIWSYGFRNPWRPSFDRLTGDLWIADVGQNTYEEINIEPRGTAGGRNYGWDCREGMHDYEFVAACESETLTEPVFEYTHTEGCSITGGYVYRGCLIPDARGRYFFGDYCSGAVRSGVLSGGLLADVRTEFTVSALTSFGEGPDGELYVVTGTGTASGTVRRIIASGPVAPPTPQDFDNNLAVDIADYDYFEGCMTAQAGTYADCLCDVFDADTDGDVDLVDFTAFQRALP